MTNVDSLPYRPCAGMMVLNRAGLVFIGRRTSGPEHMDMVHDWQMPQGGIDDGSSTRSVAQQVARGANLPFLKADVVIDTVPMPTDIDRALATLEAAARDNGSAIGYAAAQPATVARIAEWAKKVEGRGFVLVPITMVAIKAKSS